MMRKGPFIFDSHALLKFFQREKGFEKVIKILEEVQKGGMLSSSMPLTSVRSSIH